MTEAITNKLAGHVLRASRVSGLHEARCVLAIEMYANEAPWMYGALHTYMKRHPERLPDVSFLRQPGQGRRAGELGILTTNGSKREMSQMLAMMIDERRFAIHPDFACAENDPIKRYKMCEQLCDQLVNYERVITKKVGNVFADPTIIYSGKRHGPDDIAICVQLSTLAQFRHRSDLVRDNRPTGLQRLG
jgi:hypothetical protein